MNTSQAIGRMREVIRRQHKALSTEDSYIFWLRRYMTALRKMPQDLSSERKLEQFLTDLACHRDVSASTQNQAFNVYFYKEAPGQPTNYKLVFPAARTLAHLALAAAESAALPAALNFLLGF